VCSSDLALSGWTSPAAERFRSFKPATREELAARYQQLFDEADRKGSQDAGLEAFRELSYAKAGPFRAPADAAQYYPAAAREQLAQLEKQRKDLEAATPDLPRAMGVGEGEKIADLPIHLRGSHWTLGKEAPRGFLRVVAGDNQPPIPPSRAAVCNSPNGSPGPIIRSPAASWSIGCGAGILAVGLCPRWTTSDAWARCLPISRFSTGWRCASSSRAGP